MTKDPITEFWSNGKTLKEEGVFNAAYKHFIKEFRKMLDDSSNLAQSIDRNDPSNIMSKFAVEEDLIDVAEIILLDRKMKLNKVSN